MIQGISTKNLAEAINKSRESRVQLLSAQRSLTSNLFQIGNKSHVSGAKLLKAHKADTFQKA